MNGLCREKRLNINGVKGAHFATEMTRHRDRTFFFDNRVCFVFAERANHALDGFIATATLESGSRFKQNPRRLFPEKATIDLFGAQSQKFFALDRIQEHFQAIKRGFIVVIG